MLHCGETAQGPVPVSAVLFVEHIDLPSESWPEFLLIKQAGSCFALCPDPSAHESGAPSTKLLLQWHLCPSRGCPDSLLLEHMGRSEQERMRTGPLNTQGVWRDIGCRLEKDLSSLLAGG